MGSRATKDSLTLWTGGMTTGLANIYQGEGFRFASDQQYWSVKFLEAWDIMATNGCTDLEAGPEAGWLGHYSLDKVTYLKGLMILSQ